MNTSPPPHVAPPYADGPRLLADIGGTYARLALETAPREMDAASIRIYPCANYAGLAEVLQQYFADQHLIPSGIHHAGLAMANPAQGDCAHMTNLPWTFSVQATRRAFGFDTLLIVNDFAALARALPDLDASQFARIGGGEPALHAPLGLFGPGTGLGVAGLVPCGEGWLTLSSEGGHVEFAPQDAREDDVLRYARGLWPHVSFERIASGPGIALIHRALAARDGLTLPAGLDTVDIVQQAHAGDARAVQTIECFCGALGSFAGNLAVTLGARGGIYIGGGVARHLGTLLQHSPFRQRFEAKGRMSAYLSAIPTYVITAEYPALAGVSAMLAEHLAAM